MVQSCESHRTRIDFIDTVKGLGIILVVCSHVYPPLMSWATPCFVPLFYVVSGYCTSHMVNIVSKFQKLILPYALFTLVLLIAHFDFKPINFFGAVYSRWCLYPLGSTPNIFFLQSGNAPLWFLTSMFVAFCLYRFIQSSRHPWLLILFYLVGTYLLSFLPILLPWSIDTAFLMAVYIFVGTSIREKMLLDRLSVSAFIGLACVYVALTIFCGNINLSVRHYGASLLLFIPAAIIGSFLLMKVSQKIDGTFVGKILQRIGIHSLPLFCLHLPIVNLGVRLLSSLPFTLPPIMNHILIIVLVLVITYPIAIVSDKMLDKVTLWFTDKKKTIKCIG